MPRPKKGRHVQCLPVTSAFRPEQAAPGESGEVVLTIEEFEAIRLRDKQGLEQEACAAAMQVSRQTFQRILSSARVKLAAMLTDGLTLRIVGGEYTLEPGRYRCPNCHREFEVDAGGAGTGLCPGCCHDERRGETASRGCEDATCGCGPCRGPGRMSK